MGPWLIIMYKARFMLYSQQELARAKLRLWKKLKMNINATIKTLKPTLLVIGWTINSTLTYSSHVEPFFLSWMPSYLPAVDYIEYPSPMVMRNTAS